MMHDRDGMALPASRDIQTSGIEIMSNMCDWVFEQPHGTALFIALYHGLNGIRNFCFDYT